MTPGMFTSEFWMSLVLAVIGALLLIFTEHTEIAATLISVAVGGYQISRGLAKREPREPTA